MLHGVPDVLERAAVDLLHERLPVALKDLLAWVLRHLEARPMETPTAPRVAPIRRSCSAARKTAKCHSRSSSVASRTCSSRNSRTAPPSGEAAAALTARCMQHGAVKGHCNRL